MSCDCNCVDHVFNYPNPDGSFTYLPVSADGLVTLPAPGLAGVPAPPSTGGPASLVYDPVSGSFIWAQ